MEDELPEETLERVSSRSWINRARLDVLERVIVDYLVFTSPQLAAAAEDTLRHAHERMAPPPPGDATEAIKHQLANEAAVRLADLLAAKLAGKG